MTVSKKFRMLVSRVVYAQTTVQVQQFLVIYSFQWRLSKSANIVLGPLKVDLGTELRQSWWCKVRWYGPAQH